MNKIDFPFSDLLAGYVTSFDSAQQTFGLRTSDGREFTVLLTPTLFAEMVRNLGESYQDATSQVRELLMEGRFLFAYGVFYPDGPQGEPRFEAKHIVFTGRGADEYRFEQPDWWVRQIRQLADFYIRAEFGDGPIDYSNYRTEISDTGAKGRSGRQETDTISRLVYGFASAYMLTGEDRYLEAAEKGVEYLREHFRAFDPQEGIAYWYHAVDVKADGRRQKVFASEFGDDYNAIPCYEQIYALAGPVQTFRVTGDRRVVEDAEATIKLFQTCFKDQSPQGGYFSHLDPATLDPRAESLGRNRAKKNWNSVGDHAPAYLINLFLGTGEQQYADFLEYNFDLIARHFPDYQESPFVQERFFEDWSKDQTWGWQQNRAVVGHNLKIAWNLMRMHSLKAKREYLDLAERIGQVMPAAGSDQQRGGWYDVVERVLTPGQKFHRYVWHDRKAWWQQEQAILAYLILHGLVKKPEYLKLARESSAFYNAWFLDTDQGGVYFNVLANGLPYALGTERKKGSHSMAGYHSFELCFLAATYTNLLIANQPLDLFFKPRVADLPERLLRVAPDLLPAGSVRIEEVWVNDKLHRDFDAEALTVRLPADQEQVKVRVRLAPTAVRFSADLLATENNRAAISLAGELDGQTWKVLEAAIRSAVDAGARTIVFQADDLRTLTPEAERRLILTKQQLGPQFELTFTGANPQVVKGLSESGLLEEVSLA